ncbi:site-2 protease family protein [Planctomycetota bacterium]|nr:site-2 protease family protein [Planctomycetota bacterium]
MNILYAMQVLFGFGFVIFIHEMGHFLAAKRVGIKCPGFSIGFPLPWKGKDGWTGKNIFKYTWRGTEYRLGYIPFGGYVQMQGQADNPSELDDVNKDDSGDYRNKSYWQKTQVLLGGVTMNAITAVIGFVIAFQVGVTFIEPTVGLVDQSTSAAASGIEVGDKIIEVNGREVVDFEDVVYAGLFDGGESIKVKVERKVGGETKTLDLVVPLDEEPRFGILMPGIRAKHRVILTEEEAERFADYDGEIKPEARDEIVTVNGREVQNYLEVMALVSSGKGELELGLRRGIGEDTIDFKVPFTPGRVAMSATSAFELGFSLKPTAWVEKALPHGPAAKAGLKTGDHITGHVVDGKVVKFDSFGDMAEAINQSGGKLVVLEVQRDGKAIELNVIPKLRDGYTDRYQLGVQTRFVNPSDEESAKKTAEIIKQLTVYGLREGGVADKAGLKIGDKIVGANFGDEEVFDPAEGVFGKMFGSDDVFGVSAMATVFSRAAKGEEVTLKVDREGTNKSITIKPDLKGPDSAAFIAVSAAEKRSAPVTYGFFKSMSMGFYHSKKVGYKIMMTFGGLFSGRISITHLGGPLVIAKRSYSLAEWGIGTLIFFLAFISINLAIVNMLPLPVLDGGQWLIVSIEAVMKKPVQGRILAATQYISFFAVIGLMVFVLINDAVTIWIRKWV